MRLFIGIPFSESVQFYLRETQTMVLKNAIKSRKTRLENFHLTLLFIGELEGNKINELIDLIEESTFSFKSFYIKLGSVGSFVKGSEEIIWIGVDEGLTQLKKIHEELKKHLIVKKLPFDSKKFNPHITLARGVTFPQEHSTVLMSRYHQSILVDQIVLFKSHQVDGILTYTPLVYFDLES